MNLEYYIYRLLFVSDKIVIPNFGTFITKQKNTAFSKDSRSIEPPKKAVSFSSDHNEVSSLAEKISETEKISLQEANNFIKVKVEEWYLILQAKNQLELENIGTIIKKDKNKLYFVPNENENFTLDSFGLASVDYKLENKVEKKYSVLLRVLKYLFLFLAILSINLLSFHQYLKQTQGKTLQEWVECMLDNKTKFNFTACNVSYLHPVVEKAEESQLDDDLFSETDDFQLYIDSIYSSQQSDSIVSEFKSKGFFKTKIQEDSLILIQTSDFESDLLYSRDSLKGEYPMLKIRKSMLDE